MKKSIFSIILMLLLFGCSTSIGPRSQDGINILKSDYEHLVDQSELFPSIDNDKTKLTVLQFNIWQEGTIVPGGFDAIVDEIYRSDADLVAFSEVRNYEDVDFNQKTADALQARGKKYYTFRSDDSGLLSKFPIIEKSFVYPLENDQGSVTKAVLKVNDDVEIAFYSAHLDYKYCAYYDVRGYSGLTWAPKIPVRSHKKLKEINLMSKRDDAVKAFIQDAEKEKVKGRIVIFGGDFNEPSHLDWIEENKKMYAHNGVTYQWDVSVMLEKAGFVDSYRKKYPDPIKYPGFTFPSGNPLVTISTLTWAPRSDERERIDFIYYNKDSRISLLDSFILGPDYSIAYSRAAVEPAKDRILLPNSEVWPTDHKGVISIFELEK